MIFNIYGVAAAAMSVLYINQSRKLLSVRWQISAGRGEALRSKNSATEDLEATSASSSSAAWGVGGLQSRAAPRRFRGFLFEEIARRRTTGSMTSVGGRWGRCRVRITCR